MIEADRELGTAGDYCGPVIFIIACFIAMAIITATLFSVYVIGPVI